MQRLSTYSDVSFQPILCVLLFLISSIILVFLALTHISLSYIPPPSLLIYNNSFWVVHCFSVPCFISIKKVVKYLQKIYNKTLKQVRFFAKMI